MPARQMNGLSRTSVVRAADQQQLPDRIGRDQPFADRVVEREQEHADQHQADAGKRGRRGIACAVKGLRPRHAVP